VAGPAGFEPAAFGFVVRAIPSCHSTPHSDKAGQGGSDRAYPSRFRHAASVPAGGAAYEPDVAGWARWAHGPDLGAKVAVRPAVAVGILSAARAAPA